MNIILHFETAYEAVYAVNGVFLENAQKIRYEDNQAIYVTVFPLKAQLLPYTVKLIGGKVVCNKELCDSFALPHNNFFVRLQPRHNYVYSPTARVIEQSAGIVPSFYHKIKNGDITQARKLMTQDLNKCIEDDAMQAFFKDFIAIIPNKFFDNLSPHGYFLINTANECSFYIFDIVDGLIDNIRQSEIE
jgi:hypothetical protein